MSNNYTFDGDDEPYEDELYAEYEDDDPNNPRHRDHDLSDSADYDWDRPVDVKPWFMQRWFMLTISVLLVLSLLLPLAFRVG
jgi:hypothetical protein